ncbi:MAG: DUF3784 domain-containing protein [Oscillospiraceae bacterium]
MSSYIMPIIFAVLSVPFLLGKGEFFISGYNTMTDAEKEKYHKEHDVKKMCISMGAMLITISVITAIMSFYNTQVVTLYCLATIIAIVLFFVTYINVGCRKY